MEHTGKLILIVAMLAAFGASSQELEKCLELVENRKRLDCYDSALGYDGTAGRAISDNTASSPTSLSNNLDIRPVANSDALLKAQKAYNQIMADALAMTITKIEKTSQQKIYYFTDSGRVFKKMSDRSATIAVDDRVELEGGVLGSKFFVTANGSRVKVKEVN
jgi:hypothetical protein